MLLKNQVKKWGNGREKLQQAVNTWEKMQQNNYPMQERCGAKTRKGSLCQKHPLLNGRCMLHGGKSLSGNKHGRYASGNYTKDAINQRRKDALLVLSVKTLLELEDVA